MEIRNVTSPGLINPKDQKRSEDAQDCYDLDIVINEHAPRIIQTTPSGNPCTYSATCSCARTCGSGC